MIRGVRHPNCEKLHFGEAPPKKVGFLLCYTYDMEELNNENIVYMDEYPELKQRVWLRRLAKERLSKVAVAMTTVVQFERPKPPDGAA